MKKFMSFIFTALILLLLVVVPAQATGTDTTAKNLAMLEISLSGYEEADTIGITVTSQMDLELDVSKSEWNLQGELCDITANSKTEFGAVWGNTYQKGINTNVLTLAFLIDDSAEVPDESNFSYRVVVKKESEELTGNGAKGKVSLEVSVEKVKLSQTSLQLDLSNDRTQTLTATIQPDYYPGEVTWTSSNESVATVKDGKVTAKKAGTAVITAKAGEKAAACEVTVICSHDCEMEQKNVVEATCTTKGYSGDNYCSACGKFVSAGEVVPAFEHSNVELRDKKDATYTKSGYTGDTYCVDCGKKMQSGKTIAPEGLPKPSVKVSNNSKGKPVLTWTDYSEAKTYYIYRATSKSGKYKKIDSTSKGTYTDSDTSLGKTYYYKVKAIASDSKYNSDYSSYDKAYCKCKAPSISVSVSSTTGKPTIKWKKVSGAKKYTVYRATSKDGTYKALKTTTSTSYKDTSAKAGKTYYYKVKAKSSKGSSYDSIYSSIKTALCECAKPTVKIALSKNKPKVSWKKVSGATTYYVYRSTKKSSGFTLVKSTTSTSFTDKTAKKGKTYYYKVKAVAANSAANSAYSSVVKIKSK